MESTSIVCPQCHTPNRIGARFCSKCGVPLSDTRPIGPARVDVPTTPPATPPRPETSPIEAPPPERRSGKIVGAIRKLTQQVLSTGELRLAEQPETLTNGYLHPQTIYRRSMEAGQHTRYFIAQDQHGKWYLMREASAALNEAQAARTLAALSTELPNVRRIHDVIPLANGRTYLATEPPKHDGWHFLSDPRNEKLAPELAVRLGQQIGVTLVALHRYNYTLDDARSAALEKILLDGNAATLADLSTCQPLPADEAQRRKAVADDIYFLARALYWMVTGRNLSRDSTQAMSKLARLPRPLRVAILWGASGNYVSVQEMLTHLSGRNLPPLRLTSGKATHPGRVRDHNEDQFFVYEIAKGRSDQPLPAFYMVADGMGGHEAGEVASDTISASFKEWLDEFSNRKAGRATQRLGELPDDALRTAIQAANQAVFNQAQARHNNMGATVTAALIVGEQAFIANVGDSRTYLLRGGELTAITQDHSLVYRLYQAEQITYDEIYTHPQRNKIYRNLGERPDVEVDVFDRVLEAGDVLLLCCDGLWEMVRDAQIRDILRSARTPQDAADQLINAANRGGGEDNITAIVVRVDM
jgi:PPM family protein phosphatase